MLGCFEAFFAQHGLLGESLVAVFQHGTLEISAIIVAGAAGLAIGNGWLFPGTYITRHTEMALSIRLGIIALSLAFVVGYYIVLPHYLYSNKQ